jgi:predicted alpha/beta-fold hydrolase
MNSPSGTIIESDFRPAWWLRNRHAQTIYPVWFRRQPQPETITEILELPDGDFIDLVWTTRPPGPTVILLHGLEGGICSHYAKGILQTVHDAGWTGVLMHFRGCSGRHNRLARSYHSGDTCDLKYLIDQLRQRFPDSPLAAVGISLGGNVLLKYLGESGEDSMLNAAMAISVPFDLANGARALDKGFARFYQRHLITRLANKIRDKFRKQYCPINLTELGNWNNFYRFDHNVTAPLHGFNSADEYYQLSSSRQFLKDITTPTLILHSLDDPFMTATAIPEENELSTACQLELTDKGGHVGFIYGNMPGNEKYWIEKRLVCFFSDKL